MRAIIFIFLSTLFVVGYSQKYKLNNEKILFSFQTQKGKLLSVSIDSNEKYIVYRFGTSDKTELEYPSIKDQTSFEKFEYSYWLRGGGIQNEGIDLNYLTFTISQTKYVVYDTYFASENEYKVGVKVIDLSSNKMTDIKGVYKSIQGSLSIFRDDNLVRSSEELYD